jgi:hypothetical protein
MRHVNVQPSMPATGRHRFHGGRARHVVVRAVLRRATRNTLRHVDLSVTAKGFGGISTMVILLVLIILALLDVVVSVVVMAGAWWLLLSGALIVAAFLFSRRTSRQQSSHGDGRTHPTVAHTGSPRVAGRRSSATTAPVDATGRPHRQPRRHRRLRRYLHLRDGLV